MNNFCAAFALTVLVATPVSAATVNELRDFGNDFASAFEFGPLDVGLNSITGNLSGGLGSDDQIDTVKFTVAPGTELVDASFLPFAFDLLDTIVKIADAAGVPIASQVFPSDGGGTFLGGAVLGEGTYFFQATADVTAGEVFGLGYSTGLTVREVLDTPPPNVIPLPASALLVLGGMALLGGLGWRKRRTS
ncbi:MAG: hypothetical protein AAGO57_00980 [Pseudomonadota bacterium]